MNDFNPKPKAAAPAGMMYRTRPVVMPAFRLCVLLGVLCASAFLGLPARAAMVRTFFAQPFTTALSTNPIIAQQVGTNNYANGQPVTLIGLPKRITPFPDGYATNYFAAGYYSLKDTVTGAAVVINVYDGSQQQYDYNTILAAGYNNMVNTFIFVNTNGGAGISSATASNIAQNIPFAGVVTNNATNNFFSTAGTNTINNLAATAARDALITNNAVTNQNAGPVTLASNLTVTGFVKSANLTNAQANLMLGGLARLQFPGANGGKVEIDGDGNVSLVSEAGGLGLQVLSDGSFSYNGLGNTLGADANGIELFAANNQVRLGSGTNYGAFAGDVGAVTNIPDTFNLAARNHLTNAATPAITASAITLSNAIVGTNVIVQSRKQPATAGLSNYVDSVWTTNSPSTVTGIVQNIAAPMLNAISTNDAAGTATGVAITLSNAIVSTNVIVQSRKQPATAGLSNYVDSVWTTNSPSTVTGIVQNIISASPAGSGIAIQSGGGNNNTLTNVTLLTGQNATVTNINTSRITGLGSTAVLLITNTFGSPNAPAININAGGAGGFGGDINIVAGGGGSGGGNLNLRAGYQGDGPPGTLTIGGPHQTVSGEWSTNKVRGNLFINGESQPGTPALSVQGSSAVNTNSFQITDSAGSPKVFVDPTNQLRLATAVVIGTNNPSGYTANIFGSVNTTNYSENGTNLHTLYDPANAINAVTATNLAMGLSLSNRLLWAEFIRGKYTNTLYLTAFGNGTLNGTYRWSTVAQALTNATTPGAGNGITNQIAYVAGIPVILWTNYFSNPGLSTNAGGTVGTLAFATNAIMSAGTNVTITSMDGSNRVDVPNTTSNTLSGQIDGSQIWFHNPITMSSNLTVTATITAQTNIGAFVGDGRGISNVVATVTGITNTPIVQLYPSNNTAFVVGLDSSYWTNWPSSTTAGIQEAANLFPYVSNNLAFFGCTIQFAPGVYSITAPITVTNRQYWFGAGQYQTVLSYTGPTNIIGIVVQYNSKDPLKGTSFNANNLSFRTGKNGKYALIATTNDESVFEDIGFYGPNAFGILGGGGNTNRPGVIGAIVTGGGNKQYFTRCTFSDLADGIMAYANWGHVEKCSFGNISRTTTFTNLYDNGEIRHVGAAVVVENGVGEWQIDQNHFLQCHVGVYIGGGQAVPLNYNNSESDDFTYAWQEDALGLTAFANESSVAANYIGQTDSNFNTANPAFGDSTGMIINYADDASIQMYDQNVSQFANISPNNAVTGGSSGFFDYGKIGWANGVMWANGNQITNLPALTTTSNPTNAFSVGTVYTSPAIGSFIQGSSYLVSAVSGSATIVLCYTNGGVPYRIPIGNGAIADTVLLPFFAYLPPSSTFSFVGTFGTGASGYITNAVNWKQP